MRTKTLRLLPVLLVLFSCATSDAPPGPPEQTASGVTIVHDRSAIAACLALGVPPIDPLTFNPTAAYLAGTKRLGGDTLFKPGGFGWESYLCDPQKVAERKRRLASIDAVRITNRQDVVASCKFIKNASAESEPDARAQTVDLGGNVFFVLSDTSRTAEEKAYGSKTTYNYEVRRLTGEVYLCTAATP